MLSNLKKSILLLLPFALIASPKEDPAKGFDGSSLTAKAQGDAIPLISSAPLEAVKADTTQKQDSNADSKEKTDNQKDNNFSFIKILSNIFSKIPQKLLNIIRSEFAEFIKGPLSYLNKKFYKFIKKAIIESSYKGSGGFLWSDVLGIYKNESEFKEALKNSEEAGNMVRTMLPIAILVSLIKSIPGLGVSLKFLYFFVG